MSAIDDEKYLKVLVGHHPTRVLGVPYGGLYEPGQNPRHEYVDLRLHPEAIDEFPEVLDMPELATFLREMNAPATIYRTLGCDQKMFPNNDSPDLKFRIFGYFDLAFSDSEQNRSTRPFHEVIEKFCASISQAKIQQDPRLNIYFSLQRTNFKDLKIEGWSMTVWLTSLGLDEQDARLGWTMMLKWCRQSLLRK